MLNSPHDDILLLSHSSPEADKFHFKEQDGISFKSMIDEVLAIRPQLNIYSVSGHVHSPTVYEYQRYENPITSFTMPAIVDNEVGKYAIVRFNEKNGFSFETKEVVYPFP